MLFRLKGECVVMLPALGRFNQLGLGPLCGWVLFLSFFSLFVWAQPESDSRLTSCQLYQAVRVNFTGAEEADTLSIEVSDGPCAEATTVLSVTQADGFQVYRYETQLIEIMPQLIYDPELSKLMSVYVDRALHRALLRSTKDLPEYSAVDHYHASTGDFVVVGEERYQELRQANVPILWHKTGESTWVHIIYDPLSASSQVIMRGATL
jgi:hypothetical protein